MGRGGLYYRKTLPSQETPPINKKHKLQQINKVNNENDITLTEIESGSIQEMVDSSSAQLVNEINKKRKKIRIWPIILALGIGALVFSIKNAQPHPMPLAIIIISLIIAFLASVVDSLRKTTVIFYSLDGKIVGRYQQLHNTFKSVMSCKAKWHVEAEGAVSDRKRNAGASSLIKRTSISPKIMSPPYVKTNVLVPSIPVGKKTLYFMPDMILVYENNSVGAVSYENLHININSTRFIEDGKVPGDAHVVGKTWKYVNKKGGPDRRFSDNKERPIALYEDWNFSSLTGLNERIELSVCGIGREFAKTISYLGEIT
jgi:hypothetical protein